MSKETKQEQESVWKMIQIGGIIAAFITGIFGVIVALIENPAPTPLPTSQPFTQTAPPTLTVPPQTSTPSPVPPTLTPTPSLTPEISAAVLAPSPSATFAPSLTPVVLGQDWLADCISREWMLFEIGTLFQPGEKQACWGQPVASAFSTSGGALRIFRQGYTATAYLSGFLLPLPQRGTVSFSLRPTNFEKAEFWVMLLPALDPSRSGVKLQTIVDNQQRDKLQFRTEYGTHETKSAYIPEDMDIYRITLFLDYGEVKVWVNSTSLGAFPLSFSERYLFLGYRALPAKRYEIDTRLENFSVQ